jgi:hypothetical protein
MDDNDRQVTIGEAARLLAVHANTIRNWRAAGKLKSAHKALDGKKQVWLMSLQEVTRLSYQQHNNDDNNPVVTTGYTSVYTTVNQPDNNSPAGAGSQSLAIPDRPSPEYMALLAELTRLQDERRQEAEIAAAKIATLEERLRALEASQVSQAAPTSHGAAKPVNIPADSSPSAPAPLQPGTSTRRRGWWSRIVMGRK